MRTRVNIKIKFEGLKLKRKSNKICINQKFKDQIWYNQQII